jgi:hypothetical protein
MVTILNHYFRIVKSFLGDILRSFFGGWRMEVKMGGRGIKDAFLGQKSRKSFHRM